MTSKINIIVTSTATRNVASMTWRSDDRSEV
jgi:hypothetical protein